MSNAIFAFLYRLHLRILTRRIDDKAWDASLSKAIDCLYFLTEYLKGR